MAAVAYLTDMDLGIKDQLFLVGGATSGLGRGVADALLAEGARLLAVARTEEHLKELQAQAPDRIDILAGDLSEPAIVQQLTARLIAQPLAGILVNAGGPPAMPAMDTELADWDQAYRQVLRWKVQLLQGLLPGMRQRRYGRIVFVESISVKQPVANLVLSTSLRMAVVGWVKTLSQELGGSGVTLNILAPGYHDTARVQSLLRDTARRQGSTADEVRRQITQNIPEKTMGDPADFGSLAAWLFSRHSGYLNGQTISVDGGVVKGSFG